MSSANKSLGSLTDGRYTEAFQERLNAVQKIISQDRSRQKVLWLCDQQEPKSFEEYSSSGSFRKMEKFESSTYSEVLRATNISDNKTVVMKIMRALSKGVIAQLPVEATRGCQNYGDILNEIIITKALSELHNGVMVNNTLLYKTHFFCQIYEIKVVTGSLDNILSKSASEAKQSTLQNDETSSDNDNDKDKNEANNVPAPDTNTLANLKEEDRMLYEALPIEYVVSVMKHDGKPLWWMMTHKKLNADQLTSILVQVIVGLAIAETVYNYEHRDLHVSNILISTTSKPTIPYVLANTLYKINSFGVKSTIIDATFSRLSYKSRVYHRNLTSTLKAYGAKKTPAKMSLQNRSYREMVNITKNEWESFFPKTNLIWLTYLSETLMKSDVVKADKRISSEIKKIRDFTLKAKTTMDLLKKFPFISAPQMSTTKSASGKQKSNSN